MMRRHLSMLWGRLRMSLSLAAQYRWDFFMDALLSLFWLFVGLVPLWVAFEKIPSLHGWRYEEALLVSGWFMMLKGFFSAMFFPSLLELSTKVRDGSLDFLLLKPASALFLVSTSRFELWRLLDALGGLLLCIWSFYQLSWLPSIEGVVQALLLLLASCVALFAFCVMLASISFFSARLESLPFVFTSFLDFARWPTAFFRGVTLLVFTYVLPLGILTTYPVAALLGRFSWENTLFAWCGAVVLWLLARQSFQGALARYTSASS